MKNLREEHITSVGPHSWLFCDTTQTYMASLYIFESLGKIFLAERVFLVTLQLTTNVGAVRRPQAKNSKKMTMTAW